MCDGFFTNYSWVKQNVEDSALAAGTRRTDLYIGLDVWGRNFYGGGMFNLQQVLWSFMHRFFSSATTEVIAAIILNTYIYIQICTPLTV